MCVNMWIVGVPANDDPAIERDDIADYVTLLENDGSCNLYDDVRLNSIIDNFNICDISWQNTTIIVRLELKAKIQWKADKLKVKSSLY